MGPSAPSLPEDVLPDPPVDEPPPEELEDTAVTVVIADADLDASTMDAAVIVTAPGDSLPWTPLKRSPAPALW